MTALLRAELLKLRTTRTFAALVGAALALSLLVVILTATSDSGFTEGDLRLLFAGDFTGLFILLLGAIGITGEWRHRTIAGSVLAAPERVRLLAAKTLAYAAAGVVLTRRDGGGHARRHADPLEPGRGDARGRRARRRAVAHLAVAALLGALGVGVGGLVRNQTAAVTGLLVALFALEPGLLLFTAFVVRGLAENVASAAGAGAATSAPGADG